MGHTLPDFMQPLYHLEAGYPSDAVNAAIERRDESVPHLLSSLEQALEDPAATASDERYMLHIYAAFILGYLKEPKARDLIITIARHPEADDILGDVITDGLGQILANLCFDEPESLYPLIEDIAADEFARSAGLQAFGALHHAGRVSREAPKIGRNAPCPCGSGKKYKKCCGS